MEEFDLAASAEDRSRFFWWLAEWWLSPPDQDRLAGLAALADNATETPPAATADPLEAAWRALAAAPCGSGAGEPENLGAEFTRLFAGVQEGLGPPPPYESVWREDRLLGDSTLAAIEAYAKAGFADIDPAAGPQDHLGVELKFMALLALREAEARRAGDGAAAARRLDQQTAFLADHLGAWAPRWAEAIRRQAHLPLYGALAGLLTAGLDQARAELAATAGSPRQGSGTPR
jgi:TorA maturation chaperone TorD